MASQTKRFRNSTLVDRSGYWGPVTTTIDWCERNYVVSYYIAEFFNATSNVFMIAVGSYLFAQVQRFRLPPRYWVFAFFIFMIGFGSFLGHGTMRYELQFFDEFPMMYLLLSGLYLILRNETQWSYFNSSFSFICFGFIYSILHIKYEFTIIFQCLFGALLIPVAFYPLKFAILKQRDNALLLNHILCLSIFILAFIAWQLDQIYCEQLERLYLHVVWHLGTSVAVLQLFTSYMYIYLKYIHTTTSKLYLCHRWGFLSYLKMSSPAYACINSLDSDLDLQFLSNSKPSL